MKPIPATPATAAQPNFRLVEADIRDATRVEAVVAEVRPDAVVHLAARAGVRPSIEDPAGYAAVNVQGTVNLLAAACRLDPLPKFVYASSSSVYGDRPDAPFRETDPVDHPVSPYAATKKACELMAYTFHHLHGIPVTGLRFFTAYGPRNRPDLAIAKFTRLIERGEPVPMFGDGGTRRDYTFVDDIVDGVSRAIDNCTSHHLYNPRQLRTDRAARLDRNPRRGAGQNAPHPQPSRAAWRRPPDLRRHLPRVGRTGIRPPHTVPRGTGTVCRLESAIPRRKRGVESRSSLRAAGKVSRRAAVVRVHVCRRIWVGHREPPGRSQARHYTPLDRVRCDVSARRNV